MLTVDSEGVEHVGVRRRHRLRGTRYSLPAPKGGRYAVNPILREDQLNMKRVASKGNRRGPQNDDDDGVFAVEFNQDKLFERSGNAPPLINAGKAPIVGAEGDEFASVLHAALHGVVCSNAGVAVISLRTTCAFVAQGG